MGLLDNAANANAGMPQEAGMPPEAAMAGAQMPPEAGGQEMDYDAQMADMEARVPEDMKEAWDRIMVAGMKFMFDEKTNPMVNKYLQEPGDQGEKLGKAVAGLMIMLDRESRNSLPKELMIPAGIALLIMAVKYAKETGLANVTPAEYAKAIEVHMYTILSAYGIKQEQFDGYIDTMAAQQGA